MLNGQITLNCISLYRNKCCHNLLLPAMTNIQSQEGSFTICRNGKLFWNGRFTDQVNEEKLMRSGKSQGGLINITYNDSART